MITIQRPAIQNSRDEKLWEEVRKYTALVSEAPNPNLGRVQEIKEEIQKGTYLKPEMIEETAQRLAVRFMKVL